MPTARELLEQADALMRRNRKRGHERLGVPTLTDALAPTVVLPDAPAAAIDPALPDPAIDADPMSLDTLSDVPVLTDVVQPPMSAEEPEPTFGAALERLHFDDALRAPESSDGLASTTLADAFPISAEAAALAAAALPPPAVLEWEPLPAPPARDDVAATANAEPAPDAATIASHANVLEDEFILEIPPAPEEHRPAPPVESPIEAVPAPAPLPPVGREWDALAEEIRMQVLQRLDLFADTGLRDQLGARLSPIVDRASAQLIETINRELGELVRGYVAEAIEREIENWRKRS